jgi:hypothetical protein
LMDQDGNVVGVVVAKLNVLQVAQATDDIAQNVNFTIKASLLSSSSLTSSSSPSRSSGRFSGS